MAVKEVRDPVDIPENYEKLKEVIDEHKVKRGSLIPVLQKAQEIFGYLPLEVQKYVAEGMNVSLQEVYGVATFYAQFSLTPKGEHTIGLCMGTACYVKGAKAILEKVKEELGVEVGGTSEDLKFTLEATRCLGACGLAPVMMIDEDVYGRLTVDSIPDILKKYR
ncbi:MAG: Electron-bifurcating [FeFe]-hydrogenase subunit D [Firmicutes bacterium]|nr:Electron-bifurcating [FeFe]-hydrogenase subunit D [Bacillota bacterium]MBA1335147.1 Electron-bifurcating [FeFe]-hydrogenase subunit D [Bacillota bacterium]MDI6705690.1 NADH-quinone oxidoreductase subunit NuoE [Bacillota bacterium]MDI6705694.1 NADH-quinone oxidoreductase subunit NuoE [Bacillota bacterium]